jgi:hypothetical protein
VYDICSLLSVSAPEQLVTVCRGACSLASAVSTYDASSRTVNACAGGCGLSDAMLVSNSICRVEYCVRPEWELGVRISNAFIHTQETSILLRCGCLKVEDSLSA